MSTRQAVRCPRAPAGGAGLAAAMLVGTFGAIHAASCAAGSSSTDGAAGSTGSGGSGAGFSWDAGPEGGIDRDSACAVASDEATYVPVNLFIMFDKSGSMNGPPTPTKWVQSSAAMQAFFADPDSAGLRVALRFFPDLECDTDCCDTSCDPAGCSVPTVPLGELTAASSPEDEQERALSDAFDSVVPAGGTPLSAALEGALSWGTTTVTQAPAEKAVVLLVTDGEPEDCETDPNAFTSAAHEAFANAGVLTFAIGLEGSSETLMNAIASAGGTEQAILIDTATAQQQLLDALGGIRSSTLACDYVVPDSANGDPVDPTLVNVLYTPGDGTATYTIGQVASQAACPTTQPAWSYDDSADPTRIILCPATCTSVQADTGARIELLFGCSTVPA